MKYGYHTPEIIDQFPHVLKKVADVLMHSYEHRSKIETNFKDPLDIVTEVDIESEQIIKNFIQNHCPNDLIVGEESVTKYPSNHTLRNHWCWVIDPLDGTNNFVSGIPLFCVSVALLFDGYPEYGWILDPVRSELFFASKGQGVKLNGKSLVQLQTGGTATPVGLTSGTLHWIIESGHQSLLEQISSSFGKIRILGSQGLQLAYIASGRLQAGVSYETKIWDDAAGALIVEESGGIYRKKFGTEPLPFYFDEKQTPTTSLNAIAAPSKNFETWLRIFHSITP